MSTRRPECITPDFEYEEKWYIAESLPLMCAAVLILVHAGYTLYKAAKHGKNARMSSHVSKLVAIYLIMLYYLYLGVTRMSLEIFNCNPMTPDDGYSYTSFTSLECEGGLCRCGGELQSRLVPLAVIALIMYTFGFPFVVFVAIMRNRDLIMEDQYLRAHDLGDERATNPRAWDVRKKYHKL